MNFLVLTNYAGAGELAQEFRAVAALAEDPNSILSIHMVVYNHPLSPVPGDPGTYTCMQAKHSYTYSKINLKKR